MASGEGGLDDTPDSGFPTRQGLESRVRKLEDRVTRQEERLQPLLALAAAMQSLTGQLAKVEKDLATLKGQALVLGAVGTVVAPCVFALAEMFFSKLLK